MGMGRRSEKVVTRVPATGRQALPRPQLFTKENQMLRLFGRTIAIPLSLGLMLAGFSGTALAQYKLAKLVLHPSRQAKNTDPLPVKGWGLAYRPGRPLLVSYEGTCWAAIHYWIANPPALHAAAS